ncbi:MAG: glycosyltransferase family 61 protein [Hyphomicrobiales bacterium]|nr:glycosyltransferase family 61 protein [Hyphomicrobiales bacterium]
MLDRRPSSATEDSVENARLVRLNRSLHAAWRAAVRVPWRNFRRGLRNAALLRSGEGVPVAVDETTVLEIVPFEGRFPPPFAQCTVIEAAEYSTRLHPLSVNSTTTEKIHYLPHVARAPAMALEHLVDQYWFPHFGLLISREGRIWRHSFIVPWRDGYLARIKAIVEKPMSDGSRVHLLYEERLRRAPRIRGEYLLVANSEKPNYGHYMLDVVSLINIGATHGMPMLAWTLLPWQREIIAQLDVPEGLIREISPEPVFLEHTIAGNRHTGLASQNAHPQHKVAFAKILANIRRHAGSMETPKRVLICRSAAMSRNVVNRAEMIEAMKALGFAAIQPEKLSFDEQALTYAQADIIVTEFGAALTNAMFCREGTKVVEIIAEGQHDPWSSHFCAMLELEHVVLFQRQTEEALLKAPRHMKDSPFAYSVDVPLLVETVRALVG